MIISGNSFWLQTGPHASPNLNLSTIFKTLRPLTQIKRNIRATDMQKSATICLA